MEDLIKANKISAETLSYAKSIVKKGLTLLELAEKVEAKIYELGAKPAFPVNLSLNEIAAHFTPLMNDNLEYDGSSLLKIDVGAHVNGYIGDTALTVGENTELIKAAEEALKNAIKLCRPGIELRHIGKEIEDTILSHGFQPIRNLSGHVIQQYKLHSGISIPNHDNNDNRTLKEDMVIAVEPFATNGKGIVTNYSTSNIYRLLKVKPVRDMTARKMLQFIQKEYNSLPFAARWLQKEFKTLGFSFNLLLKQAMLHSYPQLVESSHGMVAQAEHTILVKDKPLVLTKRE